MPGRMQRASNAGICGNGALEAGAQPCRFTARRATNGAPPPRRRPSTSFALPGYPRSRKNGGHSRRGSKGVVFLVDLGRFPSIVLSIVYKPHPRGMEPFPLGAP